MSELLRLHPADVDAIAARVMTAMRCQPDSPWLTAKEAAEYLRCPLSRVRKLTSTHELPHEHDGSRVLYRRDQLDQFVQTGGAKSP